MVPSIGSPFTKKPPEGAAEGLHLLSDRFTYRPSHQQGVAAMANNDRAEFRQKMESLKQGETRSLRIAVMVMVFLVLSGAGVTALAFWAR